MRPSALRIAALVSENLNPVVRSALMANNAFAILSEYKKADADGGENAIPGIDLDAARYVNDDIVAWLYCSDTVIDYPVCYGDNNSYYLTHLADGTIINCGTRHEFAQWLREISGKSDFTPKSITLSTEDHIVTLSACAYEFRNARYVVHGKLEV